MSDESLDPSGDGQNIESQVESAEQSDAQAEAVVADKMADIFGTNASRQEADEHAEEGLTDPDNPDGVDDKPVVSVDEQVTDADASMVEYGEASVEELKAAEAQAAQSGDYEKATELRNLAKTKQTEIDSAQKSAPAKVADPARTALHGLADSLGLGTNKDITDLVQENPVLARITLNRIAEGLNAASMQYANAARSGASPQTLPQQPNASTQGQAQTATLDALYKDLNGFAEVAGSEVVERFIKPLKSEVLEPLREVINFVNEQRAESVRREVTQGFDAIAKNGFEDHYGKADSLSDAQRTNRQKVAQAADLIHAGAGRQGVQMSYGEAIRRAHLIVNAERMQHQARTQLVKEVKQRSTQITARPSNRVARVTKQGDAAAMAAVDNFWASRD